MPDANVPAVTPQATGKSETTADAGKVDQGTAADAELDSLIRSDETTTTTAATDAKPQPGTPDKALQKVQQELSNLKRVNQEIVEALKAGDAPDADAQQRLKERREKAITSLREAGLTELAEEFSDLAETASKPPTGDDAAVKSLHEETQRLREELGWMRAEQRFPHTDVHKVWDKACEDADAAARKELGTVWDTLSDDQQRAAVSGKAQSFFDERCQAVENRAKQKRTPGNATTKNEDRSTRSTTDNVTAPATTTDPMQAQLARARRLVKTDQD